MAQPEKQESKPVSSDLLDHVDGLYRLLDLISEQGSGGTVDKIIIYQESLECFINDLSPGAYSSLTKVNFKVLDNLSLKPIGVYGDRQEIISLLQSIKILDDTTANLLAHATDRSSGPSLRSGLYVARFSGPQEGLVRIFVIYWPEQTTWDDAAISSVKRNRETFMRYLTKMTDQVVCLMTPAQTSALIWADDVESNEKDQDYVLADDDAENSDSEHDRLFSFEVSKTSEQEEGIQVRDGFDIPLIDVQEQLRANDPAARLELLGGKTLFGILTKQHMPSKVDEQDLVQKMTPMVFRSLLGKAAVVFSEQFNPSLVTQVMDQGLAQHYPNAAKHWKAGESLLKQQVKDERQKRWSEYQATVQSKLEIIKPLLYKLFTTSVKQVYGNVDQGRLVQGINTTEILSTHQEIRTGVQQSFDSFQRELLVITSQGFAKKRQQLLMLYALNSLDEYIDITEPERDQYLNAILDEKHTPTFKDAVTSFFSINPKKKLIEDAKTLNIPDATLISALRSCSERFPSAKQLISSALESFSDSLSSKLKERSIAIERLIRDSQTRALHKQLDFDVRKGEKERYQDLFLTLVQEMATQRSHQKSTISIQNISFSTSSWDHNMTVSYQTKTHIPPYYRYNIRPFHLSADDQQQLQLHHDFVPKPTIHDRFSHGFTLPEDSELVYAQLLNQNQILLVEDHDEKLFVYLDKLSSIDHTLNAKNARKKLQKSRIGDGAYLLGFDEARRTLAICTKTTRNLHLFSFDETFKTLNSWGNALTLSNWYPPEVSLTHLCFVPENDELLIVDSQNEARIFSLISQQFRPASVSLSSSPIAVAASPDGSCLLISLPSHRNFIWAYHWSTFGSSLGIPLELSGFDHSWIMTAIVNRSNVHLVWLDQALHCRSVALDITKKSTEFMFQESGDRKAGRQENHGTLHNSFIDCHAAVWTRYPVLPAIRRHTVTSSGRQRPKRIFISYGCHSKFRPYFEQLVRDFETGIRKPTGEELKKIIVESYAPDQFLAQLVDSSNSDWAVSKFRVGEWLVDLLCLIPIHLAITQDNRFVPLKDGVSSSEFEHSLLGAEVGRIVDSLSFGWYESIFHYLPLTSTLGEQSVGKSFALNHLVDTSFAGSAMRTTEGVWMSVTPTDDSLVVALDFEGVHSIERSAQEDTLLVLFNTAISNLVLFRNNFALSRDLTGLFQSFQSSASVLDPASNPMLFQSTLCIIIKDVVESDKNEIVKEFSLKFQKIVQEEQDANFISQLHRGHLSIVPWPVIGSKQFYTLFTGLKRVLYEQTITHPAAGQFLHTLKVLMAKLKANDWGAMSQTLAAHRAQCLHEMLPSALLYGLSEATSDAEPLKNLDTNLPIDYPDTAARFTLRLHEEASDRATVLSTLQQGWSGFNSRKIRSDESWIIELSQYMEGLVDMRIAHVKAWIESNLSRFKADHANIELLRREFNNAAVDLKESIQMCKKHCSACDLYCPCYRQHDSDQNTPHDCGTSHRCPHYCEDVQDNHPEETKTCNFRAGHDGPHICKVEDHLCGEPCILAERPGCLNECTQVAGHDGDDHRCSARVHGCGKPCGLRIMIKGNQFICPDTCSESSDRKHTVHACEARMCPVPCSLCKRLCTNLDHLHGLQANAVHLCGESHPCQHECSSDGICEINTSPQSIEATFTGRHETFQYTKVGTVYLAKRLPCAISIPPGQLGHNGPHCHTLDPKPFHFCETRCANCEYYCTLPRGHSQREHDTRHGSMSQTRWAIDGPDGTNIELNGRKFASNDDGAPMMCNLICQDMGRHVHLDYCRTNNTEDGKKCQGSEHQHIDALLFPNPERPKDWITHKLFWQRSDPYSRDEQEKFSRCDAMCPGPEHSAAAPSQPSYCTLPMFHAPNSRTDNIGMGYVSSDGHLFSCKNPVVLQQAFHVSGSMGGTDRQPIRGTPVSDRISRHCPNRLGAVYSALYGFWMSRASATNSRSTTSGVQGSRRDSYSLILFDHNMTTCLANDFSKSPEELIETLLPFKPQGGTNYNDALKTAQQVMTTRWSAERTPIVIFLSDGECDFDEDNVKTLCRASIAKGKPLSFHSVSFGPRNATLQRMAQIALEIQRAAPRDPNTPATSNVDSSYAEALDSVRLAQTFLGLAESLKKTRGSLLA
ncbi:hypothetical protein BDN72DRAFT_832681 [Pluteus cervinus]|uniref:Uncharacterized protein n=1 Tax=Pluteus cervinus TaxID=181527 RepID=A0ACD3BAX1_9AGAR|nr:hypothetical protein BDN72DRAFT_832681 [Pluteus cervinus]